MSRSAPSSAGAFEKAVFIRLKAKSKLPAGDFEDAKCTYLEASEWVRTGGGNVGLVLNATTDILDVDLDEPRVLGIADYWLPPTPWMFGRETAPRSHRLYTVTGSRRPLSFSHGETRKGWKEKKFIDLRCKMEGKSGYTVVPPGTHDKTGERIVWMTESNVPWVGRPSDQDPPAVDFKTLVKACGVLAAITIAATCWGEGGRHDLMLALDGYLAKREWDIDTRRSFIHHVNEISDLPWDVRERDGQVEATLRNTQRKIEAGDKDGVAGITQLTALMGEKQARAFDRAMKASEESDDDDDKHATFTWDGFARSFGEERHLIWWEEEAYTFSEDGGWQWVKPEVVACWALDWLTSRMIGKHGELKAASGDVKELLAVARIRLAVHAHPPVVLSDNSTLSGSEWLLGVGNGILDLRTGDLQPYSADVFFPRQTPVPYDASAQCPRWDAFLSSLVGPDEDPEEGEKKIRSVEEMLAYPLTKWRGAQKIFALIGVPRSGKGTMLRLLERLLGRSVVSVEFSDLGSKFGLEAILGKTAMYIHEPAANFRHTDLELTTSRLKAISGGDEISVNRKNKTNVQTRPHLAIIMAMNDFPRLNDRSGALASRFHPVRLTESFLGREDTRLDEDLGREAPGVLRRLSEVCKSLYEQQEKEGRVSWTLTRDAIAQQEENEAMTGSLMHFSQLSLERDPGSEVSAPDLLDAYLGYCADMGAPVSGKYRVENAVRVFMADVVRMPIFRGTEKTRRLLSRRQVVYRLGVRLSDRGRTWAEEQRQADDGDRREARDDRGAEMPF